MICGVDEAGRGPVLGPLVICAVAVESDDELKALGVKDSKQLTARKREELARRIRKVAKVETIVLDAEHIDSLRNLHGLNEIEAWKMAELINLLGPEVAYVDAADASEKSFEKMVRSELKCEAKIVSEHKADRNYPVVSAASIIAKVTRDECIRGIEVEMGEPIGSGYTSDPVTVAFVQKYIKKHGKCPPHTRESWETAKNLMMLNSLRPLDSFEG
ncbi:MAG: ribonuclease HII [Thermoplasmata archaeon]|jgi:ribonuclease HII|nr:ribonuclease HII [Thermoplasmata archaeon]